MRAFAQRHPILSTYLYFAYFSVSYQLLVYSSGMSGWTGLRQGLVMSVLWLIPVLLWPKRSKAITAIIGVVLWSASLVGLGYWLIYQQDFSQSALFIIFESNLAEGSEFIESYLHWWFLPVITGFSIAPFLLWRLIPPFSLAARTRYGYTVLFALVVSWPLLNTWIIKQQDFAQARYHLVHRLEPAAPWNLVVGYLHYREQLAAMDNLLENNHRLPPLDNFEQEAAAPNTIVLVIGESTNRQRMSLYGYPRSTTPRLDAMGDELLVFNDVVSPRPYTIEALQQALSFADSKNPQAFFTRPNLLNMVKQAGYEITWITNQQTQTQRNTMLTMFSQLADHQVYLNNNREQNANQYDGQVINPFAEALASPDAKKMIIVHLLGTHRGYDNRYPESFAKFADDQGAPEWVGEEQLSEYNSYDNAILYNDHVVAELINRLRQQDDDALFIYFSDHGEEVYDHANKLFCGRSEGAPTAAMYTVPFIVWASPVWRASHQLGAWQNYLDRPFSSADFIYTLANMIGLNFDGMDRSRSLVSKYFVPHTRWIGNPQNPETLQPYSNISG